jgi:hypothetical protein
MATKYLGSTSGLTILSSAGQTRISSEFNSGVMPTGIKGAWLSSSDDTNLVNGGTDPDRSGNGNDLDVTGTIIKTPVATLAELMGYSGYSTNNYQQQPNNTDLDFGTGDFSVEFWIKATFGLISQVVHRSLAGSAGGLYMQVGTGGTIAVFASASTSFASVLTSTVVVATGNWEKVKLKRKSGVISWTINGVLDNSVANTTNLTYALAVLRVGRRNDIGGGLNGSLSELHISNTARTEAEDLEAYNLEKPLFYPAALAVLSADDVTALSHDPVTGLLYTSGASGTATISGITPITRDATAVSTFISVVDELEIKQ